MAVTSVGAIYATQSKLLQRIYIPSSDDLEIQNQHLGVGETLQLIPIAIYQQGGESAVQAAVGIPEISGRCAVVNGANTCAAIIIADPAIYADPNGGLVVSSDQVAIGDSWDGT